MNSCIDEGTLQAWLDGELAANEAANVTAHLNSCAQCAATARTVEAESLLLSGALYVWIRRSRNFTRPGFQPPACHAGARLVSSLVHFDRWLTHRLR